MRLNSLATGVLAAALSGFAFAKLFGRAELETPYVIAAYLELLAATGLVLLGTRSAAAWIVMWAFSGAAAVTATAVLLGATEQACRCLGAVQIDRGTGLAIQGTVVVLAALVVAGSERPARAPAA